MDAPTGLLLASAIASFTGAGASLVKLMADIYREGRKRKWEQQDRRKVADSLAVTVSKQHGELKDAIEENTVSTNEAIVIGQKAYTEANNTSDKIARLHAENKELNARLLEAIAATKPHTP